MNAYHDSIVEEIHNTRKKLKEQFSGDMTAYSKSALAHCKAMGFKFATLASISTQPDNPRDETKASLFQHHR